MTLLNSAAYAHIMNITASSHLEEYFRSTGYLYHVPNNVTDGSYRTAWVENAPGDGIGEWIQLTFDQPYTINGIEISNGYKKSQAHYQKNSRLRKMRLHFSDGSYQDYNLQDTFAGAERIQLSTPVISGLLRIEILETYTGTQYNDTCITELDLF